MDVRVLDLDGSIVAQHEVIARSSAAILPLEDWGRRIRLACSFGTYRQFESELDETLRGSGGSLRSLTFYGSGDFHHVTLALLRRLRQPFNLLVLDKHPDWMRGVPILHCGTWLFHALRLPMLQRVYHIGGDLDFDNFYRWLAPWRQLRERKVITIPAVRRFRRGLWRELPNEPLRESTEKAVNPQRLSTLLQAERGELARSGLYISLDKDVMCPQDAVVNWDSGFLNLAEVQAILSWFLCACGGNVVGMDIVGDWSPVRLRGLLRRALHWTEHPRLDITPYDAIALNTRTNQILLDTLLGERAAAAS
jgi:hypothetical protein